MDTRPLAPGTLIRERYRVVRLVAGGGMAWVYEVAEALADGTAQVWAMKELRPGTGSAATLAEARQLFDQEANILVRLAHPNLPRVVAYFQDDGRSYLVMEFIRGESLEKRLETANAPLLEGQVLDWAVQVCEVLGYLHAQPRPIIFRDLKPSNIMVTEDGSIKLIDFGIARTYKAGQRKDTVTMGSENYAAPEQWGEAQTDPRADVYGLGATMYHLLANVPPLPAFVPSERVPLRRYNPAVSEGTAAAVEKAMEPNREGRFASAEEMRGALLACLPRRERRRAEARLLGQQRQAEPTPAEHALARAASAVPQAPAAAAEPRGGQAEPGTGQAAPAIGQAESCAGQAEPGAATPAPAEPEPFAAPPEAPAEKSLTPRRLGATPQGAACPACGAPNRDGARFCAHCGTRLGREPQAVLTLVEPAPARWEYPLHRSVVLVGRRGGALPVDLDVGYYDPEGYVSRNHARFMAFQGHYHVMDVGSANGTYVNGQRLVARRPRLLASGDRIRIGQVVLAFLIY
jgi:predicted Ser/Thr protein kinase